MVDGLPAGLSGVEEAITPGGVRLLSGDVPRGRHDEVWRDLLGRHAATGWYPVLGPAAEWAAEQASWYPADMQGPAALAEALTVDPAARVEQLRRAGLDDALEEADEEGEAYWRAEYDPASVAAGLSGLVGPGPGLRRQTSSYPPGSVLLVPARAGYEVPVLVPGLIRPANMNLDLVDHLAVLRHWHRRHGAELYFTGVSSLELSVAKPPATTDDIARCAVEQMSYCEDVSQFLGDVGDVARKQARGDHWSFWWD